MKIALRLIRLAGVALLGAAGCVAAGAAGPATDPSATQNATRVTESSSSAPVFRYRLSNGLDVWVKPDHRAPTVAHMVWYRVGARDEVDGTSGVAHMLEHMMFRGSRNVPPGEFSRRVAAMGGSDNAFTTSENTVFYQRVASRHLPEVMALEADRMAHLTLSEAQFKREVEVVKEERRMRTDEHPRARFWERLNAATWMTDPYRRPVIGWMSDINAYTIEDLRDFYHRWYRPDNAVVVVVGDVDPATVRQQAERAYGRVPRLAGPMPERKPRTEPEQGGEHRVEYGAPASQSYVALVYKVSGLTGWNATGPQADDAYALALLAAVLDGTSSSRLQRHLVQGEGGVRLADGAGASYGFMARGPVTFVLDGTPAAGHTVEEVETALRGEVARVAREGVTPEELARIKTQWMASQVYARDSMMAQAQDLGSNWVLGAPPEASDLLLERLGRVTPEQVRSVAERYFGSDSLTVGVLRAQPLPAEAAPETEDAGSGRGQVH